MKILLTITAGLLLSPLAHAESLRCTVDRTDTGYEFFGGAMQVAGIGETVISEAGERSAPLPTKYQIVTWDCTRAVITKIGGEVETAVNCTDHQPFPEMHGTVESHGMVRSTHCAYVNDGQ